MFLSTIKDRLMEEKTDRMKKTISNSSQVTYFWTWLSPGSPPGTAATALRCPGGLAVLKLCCFASHLTRDERMQSLAVGSKARIALSLWAPIELQTPEPTDTSACDERLCWLIWNPKERLFIWQCQTFKIRTKRRRRRKRTSVSLTFACESCKELWKRRVSPSAFSCFW